MKCECVEKLNASENMVANNTYIETATMMNMKTGDSREVINIPLVKLHRAGAKPRGRFITANYCPFCGMDQSVNS